MEAQIEAFARELKSLIVKYGFSFARVNQALAILTIEFDEKKLKTLFEGKK